MWKAIWGTWLFRRLQRRRTTQRYYAGGGGLLGMIVTAWSAYKYWQRRQVRRADA